MVGLMLRLFRVTVAANPSLLPLALAIVTFGAFALGCTPNVGDSCQLSTDCGSTGQLVCDTSEFDGYCTEVDCISDSCPDNAGCIGFYPSVPGCGYNDRTAGSRFTESFCMATCESNSDCRDYYVCANPTESPWFAVILDDNQQETVCLPMPNNGAPIGNVTDSNLDPDAAVCQVTVPMWDAGFPEFDAFGSPDASSESGAGDAAHKGD
jgi:hypothetical protein